MSVLIKDMEKPKSCFAVIDGEYEYCPFVNTDDDCVLLAKKGICESTWEEQHSKCPLVEVPELCEDAVSRKDAIIQLSHNKNGDLDCDVIIQHDIETLKQLPSVTPKRKTGKWIEEQRSIKVTLYKCSECGRAVIDDTGYDAAKDFPFCHCGADMRQREESK